MPDSIYRCTGCARDYSDPQLQRCPYCLRFLFALPVAWAGTPVTNKPRRATVLKAQALRARRFRRRRAGPVMAAICGVDEVPAELTVVITGEPGAGKSTTLIALLEDGTWSSPLLVASEEGLGVGLADRLARAEATATSVCDAASYPELVALLEEQGAGAYDCVAVDSISTAGMAINELVALRKAYGVSVVAICQVLKDGRFAGANTLKHESELFIRITSQNRFQVQKSWFSPCPREGLIHQEDDDAQA